MALVAKRKYRRLKTTPHATANRHDDKHKDDREPSLLLSWQSYPLPEYEHPPLRLARPRNVHVPRHDRPGYALYEAMPGVAFAKAARWPMKEPGSRTNTEHIE